MKKDEIPQDRSALDNVSKELCYAVDETGKYETALSKGWHVKAGALDLAWNEIRQRVDQAAEKVKQKQASPILYFMELKLMDPELLAAYTGFWKWKIKRHMKPHVFHKLPEWKLRKYADLFEVPLDTLRNPFGD